jgi:hypothetical protein
MIQPHIHNSGLLWQERKTFVGFLQIRVNQVGLINSALLELGNAEFDNQSDIK